MTVTVSVAETYKRFASEGGFTGGVEEDLVRWLLDAPKRLMTFWTLSTVSADKTLLCFLQTTNQYRSLRLDDRILTTRRKRHQRLLFDIEQRPL